MNASTMQSKSPDFMSKPCANVWRIFKVSPTGVLGQVFYELEVRRHPNSTKWHPFGPRFNTAEEANEWMWDKVGPEYDA